MAFSSAVLTAASASGWALSQAPVEVATWPQGRGQPGGRTARLGGRYGHAGSDGGPRNGDGGQGLDHGSPSSSLSQSRDVASGIPAHPLTHFLHRLEIHVPACRRHRARWPAWRAPGPPPASAPEPSSPACLPRLSGGQPLGLPVVLGPAAHRMLAWLRCPPCSAMNTFSTTSVDWTPPRREPSKSPAAPASGRSLVFPLISLACRPGSLRCH